MHSTGHPPPSPHQENPSNSFPELGTGALPGSDMQGHTWEAGSPGNIPQARSFREGGG